jgi:hypothetical protein
MKFLTKAAIGAVMLAGASALTAAPAEARVTVGFEFGGPGYAVPAYCDPYSRYYDPYRCDDYGDDYYDYYNGPVFIDGIWLSDGFRTRWYHGHREFYYHGGWRSGSGWHDNGFRRGGWGRTDWDRRGGWGHGGGSHGGGSWSGGGGHGGRSWSGHGGSHGGGSWSGGHGGSHGGGHDGHGGGHDHHH